jgi:hypothetical protein
MRLVMSNKELQPIDDINFGGIDEVDFIVITNDKFESYWVELKEKCKVNFIKCKIYFIIPRIDNPKSVCSFLTSFGDILG